MWWKVSAVCKVWLSIQYFCVHLGYVFTEETKIDVVLVVFRVRKWQLPSCMAAYYWLWHRCHGNCLEAWSLKVPTFNILNRLGLQHGMPKALDYITIHNFTCHRYMRRFCFSECFLLMRESWYTLPGRCLLLPCGKMGQEITQYSCQITFWALSLWYNCNDYFIALLR